MVAEKIIKILVECRSIRGRIDEREGFYGFYRYFYIKEYRGGAEDLTTLATQVSDFVQVEGFSLVRKGVVKSHFRIARVTADVDEPKSVPGGATFFPEGRSRGVFSFAACKLSSALGSKGCFQFGEPPTKS